MTLLQKITTGAIAIVVCVVMAYGLAWSLNNIIKNNTERRNRIAHEKSEELTQAIRSEIQDIFLDYTIWQIMLNDNQSSLTISIKLFKKED